MTDTTEVTYDEEHWELLRRLRSEAAELMHPLASRHIATITYGSVARGDVSQGSDVDVFIPSPPPPAIIEALVERAGFTLALREIVQATPTYAAKGYLHLDETHSYSFPLVPLRPVELELYGFAGSIGPEQAEADDRVPGVDKRLMLIEPTEAGHRESPVAGREGAVAKMLGVGVITVLDRVRTLRRRERIGRTGVYIKHHLAPGEDFAEAYRRLASRRPPLRRRMRS
jgi:predicted nucleotidyltransferase